MTDVTVYGAPWCPDCKRAKAFLSSHRVAYDWVDIDQDAAGLARVQEIQRGGRTIPTIVFSDGSVLLEPSDEELAARLGIAVRADRDSYDLIIVGGGPTGLAAAMYAAREGIDAVVIDSGGLGGNAGVTERIDNYPGFPDGIGGRELMDRFVAQARRYGVELLGGARVESVRPDDAEADDLSVALTSGQELAAHAPHVPEHHVGTLSLRDAHRAHAVRGLADDVHVVLHSRYPASRTLVTATPAKPSQRRSGETTMEPVNGYQTVAACPVCGSPAAVHSIQELADLARMQLDQLQQGPLGGQPGGPAQPPPGQDGGFGPMLGPGGSMPGPGAPMPDPMSGPGGSMPSPMSGPGGSMPGPGGPMPAPGPRPRSDQYTDDEDLASAVLSEAARLIGRAIGRRVQRTYNQRVQPPLAAQAEERLRTQIAIAERHPDVRACLNDAVIFLEGGQRTLPMPNLPTLTVEQADALVANLRSG